MNDNSMCRESYMSMLKELGAYEAAGIDLFLCGDSYSARDIAYVCAVKEDGDYMCDFVPDQNGSLSEIHFDRIAKKKSIKRRIPRKKAV